MDRDIGMGSLESRLDDHLNQEEDIEPDWDNCQGCDGVPEEGQVLCHACAKEDLQELYWAEMDDMGSRTD